MTAALDQIIDIVKAELPRIVRYSPERFAAHASEGAAPRTVEVWLTEDWLSMQELIAPIDAFADDALIALLRANEAPARCRLSTDGRFAVARADHPLHIRGSEGVLDLLRELHATARKAQLSPAQGRGR